MNPTNLVLELDRRSLGTGRLVEEPLPPLPAGQVRLRIERVALTANTVTYAVTGDVLGYWGFFPGANPGWGRVPAMGWATVVESRVDGVEPGQRCYGWYPLARYVDFTATATAEGFRDDGAHRQAHAPVYRAYSDTRRDPLYQPGEDAEDRHALLRGLYVTGWLADDFLHGNGYYGARRALVLSASSKTALGYAHCASQRDGLEIVGLTSPRNHAFVEHVGCYDEALAYDEVSRIPRDAPIVSIDMSGSGPLLAAVHGHFGDSLKHSMAIGRSHHDSPPRADGLPGPKPEFFFAPTQVKRRVQEWGLAGYQARIGTALHGFVDWSRAWLTVQRVAGGEAAVAAWGEAHAGRTAPDRGCIVTLWER